MNWKNLIGKIAPTIGTAIGSPLSGMAVSVVLNALGVKKEDEIEEVIKDPEALVKLKQAEMDFKAKMKELDINIERIAKEDRDSARQREIAVKDKTPSILAVGYTIGYFAVLIYILGWGQNISGGVRDLINILLGALSAAQVNIIGYYFGSSHGSAQKNEMLSRGMMNN
ncbi:MAG: hypothetical protein V1749_03675 [Candidatus Desantisbacteria bacterium]